jgi:hypothetical protein
MSYTEHMAVEIHGFRVTDATSTDPLRPHDDLVWVGYGGMEGRWLTADRAEEVARAIDAVVQSHRARRQAACGAKQS